jgi:DDE superfamily endonuclease
MGRKFINNEMNISTNSKVEPNGPILSYFTVADEGFPLSKFIMRPYPARSTGKLPCSKEIFNYRLSWARRVIETAFGILVARWGIFKQPIVANENTIHEIIKATVCLHNFILTKEK